MSYFEKIWASDEYKDREYGIPWAVNESVKNALKDSIYRIQQDKSHPYWENYTKQVDLKMADIEQNTILSNIDDEFDQDKLVIKYIDIDFEEQDSLGLLGRFYCELYIKEFPDENERESLDNIIKQAKRMKNERECRYHCILATLGGQIVGGIIGDYFAKSNCGVIEFIVVEQSKRQQRIGSGLISNLINFFNTDAQKYSNKSKIDYYFFEVENPNRMITNNLVENCKKRLSFWNKMSADLLEINYVQPPLEKGKSSVDYLFLAICVVNTQLSRDEIKKERIIRFLQEFFMYAFGIEDINNCKEYKKMICELEESGVDTIKITRITEMVVGR